MSLSRFLIIVWVLGAFGGVAEAQWDQFRGPNGSGVAPAEWRPPVELAMEKVAWKAELPMGLSSPVVRGGKVFLTGLERGRLVTVCLDAQTGKRLWVRDAPEVPLEPVHETGHPAAPTPLVDERRVYVYFGSFGLLCYDHEGRLHWQKPIPTPKSLYGMSTSPVAHGEHLILVLDDHHNLPDSKLSRSKILCLRKDSAQTVWEAARPFNRSAWSTPMVWQHDQGEELVVLGSGRAAGYDLKDGAELWHATGFSRETIAVPVAGNGHVYIASAQLGGGADKRINPQPFWDAILRFDANGDGKVARSEMTEHFTYPLRPELPLGHPGFGIPLPKDAAKRNERQQGIFGWADADKDNFWTEAEWRDHLAAKGGRPILMAIAPGGRGNIEQSHVRWELNRSVPEIPSPLYYDKRIYMVRNGGLLAAVDAEQGEQIYRERLGGSGQYGASPVAANDHLYLASDRGLLSVVKAGGTFELVQQLELGEPVRVTPAMDANTLYVRGEKHLWAFRD